jgi:AcrR family transcriptional regulator
MPPPQKFSKEEIIAASLNLVRREGIEGVTARALGAELKTSSQPIFTTFKNMEEVREEMIKAARTLYNSYMEIGFAEKLAFKGAGMQYLRFAKEEPRLFELLFMTTGKTDAPLSDILSTIYDNEVILATIRKQTGISRKDAYRIYQALWIFVHGIACLFVTGVSRMTEDEVSILLNDVFIGMLLRLEKGEK